MAGPLFVATKAWMRSTALLGGFSLLGGCFSDPIMIESSHGATDSGDTTASETGSTSTNVTSGGGNDVTSGNESGNESRDEGSSETAGHDDTGRDSEGSSCGEGTFACGGECIANGGCSAGTGSCQNSGVKQCLPGGTVGCSVEAKEMICTPNATSDCDPCGTGSRVGGSRLCDADGCVYGSCTPGSGLVLTEYAPAWEHACGWEHDNTGTNWRCETNPLSLPSCTCASRTVKLPGGTYRISATAGFPPINTPMTIRVMANGNQVASQTFDVEGLAFTVHQMSFALVGCSDVTIEILRATGAAGYVINQLSLERI